VAFSNSMTALDASGMSTMIAGPPRRSVRSQVGHLGVIPEDDVVGDRGSTRPARCRRPSASSSNPRTCLCYLSRCRRGRGGSRHRGTPSPAPEALRKFCLMCPVYLEPSAERGHASDTPDTLNTASRREVLDETPAPTTRPCATYSASLLRCTTLTDLGQRRSCEACLHPQTETT
jgi:hypothetical protein